jgi:RimJ/RimL family protein N-acetyltransferase
MELKTKRLVLREYSSDDAKEIVSKINNLEVSKYLAMVPYPYELKLNRLVIPAYVPNAGSNGLAEKLGFKFEGTQKQSARVKSTGKVYDTNYWGLLKGEWKK